MLHLMIWLEPLSQHRETFESVGIEFSQSTHDAVTELSANVVEKCYFWFLKGFRISHFKFGHFSVVSMSHCFFLDSTAFRLE